MEAKFKYIHSNPVRKFFMRENLNLIKTFLGALFLTPCSAKLIEFGTLISPLKSYDIVTCLIY